MRLARSFRRKGVDGRHKGDHDGDNRPTYPRPQNLAYHPLAHHPYGAAVRRYARGWVRVGACGRGLRPAPGRLREPTWGHYDPCARSSLDEAAAPAAARDRRGDNPLRGTGFRGLRGAPATGFAEARPGVLKIAEGGAPRGVRTVAQPVRPHPGSTDADTFNAPRGAPPAPYDSSPAGSACGRGFDAPLKQGRGEPFSWKEKGRDEVFGLQTLAGTRPRGERRASLVKRPTPHPTLSFQERVSRALGEGRSPARPLRRCPDAGGALGRGHRRRRDRPKPAPSGSGPLAR